MGHLVVQGIGCECVETEHPGLLCAQLQDVEAQGLVIIFITIVAPGGISLEHLLAAAAVLAGRHF